MALPSNADAFQVLCLQAADGGRGDILFGESLARVRELAPPFVVGEEFPSIYFEFPLVGKPFLDVTLLLGQIEPGTRIESAAAAGTGEMLDWYAGIRRKNSKVDCGFELDTKSSELASAAIHFQPREMIELVEPFCKLVGEPERAALYLELSERMPKGWPLSFFGMFRGRKDSPLRVCGYLDGATQRECAGSPQRLAEAFDAIGFSAYDQAMLAQVSTLMANTPGEVDFQFDVHPDGTLGNTFAIDTQFDIEQPATVQENFSSGAAFRLMSILQDWGAADNRWCLAADAAFARALPVQLDDGSWGRYSFSLIPRWAKVRWTAGALQPSKLYLLGTAGLLDPENPKGET